jgi:hypothetical protein
MGLNKRGQVIFYTFMLGLTILILALALAPSIKQQTDTARNPDNLNCTNPEISNFDKATCYVADLTLFHFVGGLIFIAGVIITARIVIG